MRKEPHCPPSPSRGATVLPQRRDSQRMPRDLSLAFRKMENAAGVGMPHENNLRVPHEARVRELEVAVGEPNPPPNRNRDLRPRRASLVRV